jgi:hypothetical protein
MAGEEGEAEILTMIQLGFVSRNVIKEIVDRHARGVVGFEPAWRFTPRRPLDKDEDPTPPSRPTSMTSKLLSPIGGMLAQHHGHNERGCRFDLAGAALADATLCAEGIAGRRSSSAAGRWHHEARAEAASASTGQDGLKGSAQIRLPRPPDPGQCC